MLFKEVEIIYYEKLEGEGGDSMSELYYLF